MKKKILTEKKFGPITNEELERELDLLGGEVLIHGNPLFHSIGCNKGVLNDVESIQDPQEVCKKLTDNYEHQFQYALIHGKTYESWQFLYYDPEYVSYNDIKFVEAVYFGDCSGFLEEDGTGDCYVPSYITVQGKTAICEYLGVIPEEYTVIRLAEARVVHNHKKFKKGGK